MRRSIEKNLKKASKTTTKKSPSRGNFWDEISLYGTDYARIFVGVFDFPVRIENTFFPLYSPVTGEAK